MPRVNIIHAGFGGDPNEVKFTYLDKSNEVNEEICERAFHMFNAPMELLNEEDGMIAVAYRTEKLRSLSVGDIVEVDGERWLCKPFGWQKEEEYLKENPGEGDIFTRKVENVAGVSRSIG